MTEPPITRTQRILVIGRSPSVILEAADILRSKGFHADATNQFDEVLTEYDTTNLDVVVFGGMVPPNARQHLRKEISKVNDHVTFLQGLAGIPGLVATQVEGVMATATDDHVVTYDPRKRTVQLTSTSMRVIDGHEDSGEYLIPLPAEVPPAASFVTVSVGPAVHAFTVGAMPEALMRVGQRRDPAQSPPLPPVRAVATHHTD